MDATASGEEKAPRPTGDAASAPVAEQPASPLPGPDALANAGSGNGAVVESSDEEDEQVERFYALLDNIRALRGMYRAGAGTDCGSAGQGRKRAREAEPPWRPAFRMEDFEEEVVVVEAKKQSRDGGARRPTGKGTDAAAGEDEEGEVVEARGRKGRRVAARG